MADEVAALFMFGDDLEAILDVLEDNEKIQNDFTAAVSQVSLEDCIYDSNYSQIHSTTECAKCFCKQSRFSCVLHL